MRRAFYSMPWTDTGRTALFWLACIPARTTVAFLAFHYSGTPAVRNGFAVLATVAAAGLLVNFSINKNVGFSGGEVWWNRARPVHAAVLTTYAALTFFEVEEAWCALLADVGLAALFKLGCTRRHAIIS